MDLLVLELLQSPCSVKYQLAPVEPSQRRAVAYLLVDVGMQCILALSSPCGIRALFGLIEYRI